MRTASLLTAALVLAACQEARPTTPPPTGAFYFPTGVYHVDRPGSDDGVLYVVSANFDKRYDFGSIQALDLSSLGLPAFGSAVASSGPVSITDLKVQPGAVAYLNSFGAELDAYRFDDGSLRLFVPTRSEGQKLFAVDTTPGAQTSFRCVGGEARDNDEGTDCTQTGWSLVKNETDTRTSQPRAPGPIGVTVNQNTKDVWVTHAQPGDTPRGSAVNYVSYLVHTLADAPGISDENFINIGPVGGTQSVAVTDTWAFASGRYHSWGGMQLTRMVQAGVDGEGAVVPDQSRVVFNAGLEFEIKVGEGRGIALSANQSRLYVAGRSPDLLVVAEVTGANARYPSVPVVRAVRSVPLPEAPQVIRAIARPGRADLVLVPCASAGVLAIYDDDVGDLASQVPGIGLQPSQLTVDEKTVNGVRGARVFISNFTDGRVAVIDIPNLDRPQDARVVAQLGRSQLCVTRGFNDSSCTSGGVVQ